MKDKNAEKYDAWQEKQRKKDLPEYCIKTLDRIKKNAKKLNRQEEGSNHYNQTLQKLKADKDKFYRQLKNTKKVSINQVVPVKKMLLTHYALDIWKEIQKGNEENYQISQSPYDLYFFIFSRLSMQEEAGQFSIEDADEDFAIKTVVIDEEYKEWLKKENKNDSPKNRMAYCTEISDEDADRLLRKNRLDVTYTLCGFPIILSFGKEAPHHISSSLSGKTVQEMYSVLGKYFGEENVFVPGIICTEEVFLEDEDEILKMADCFYREKPFDISHYKEQVFPNDDENQIVICPFVVQHRVNSATIPLTDVITRTADNDEESFRLDPTDIVFDDLPEDEGYEISRHFAMSKTNLYERFSDDFSHVLAIPQIYPGWVDALGVVGTGEDLE